MSSRTQSFLPKKIQRSNYTPRTQPDQFEDMIREAFDFSRKISKKSAFEKDADRFYRETYQGDIEKRRKSALRESLTAILQRHDSAMDKEDVVLSWIELNAPMVSYTKMEQRYHVLFAAAIWMLDRITEQPDWRRELFKQLPRNDREIEEFLEPDVWDCCYEYDLIASVVHVLSYRNLNAGRKKAIDPSTINTFEERLQLLEDNPHTLISEYAATHALPDDWRTAAPYDSSTAADSHRERFRALLALIPQEEIDDIVEQFRDLFQRWIDRFFEGLAAIDREQETFDQKKDLIAKEHNALVDELEVFIDGVEEKRRSKTVRKDKDRKGTEKRPENGPQAKAAANPQVNPLLANPQNPLLFNPMTGTMPGLEEFIRRQGMNQKPGLSNNITRSAGGRSAFGLFGDSMSGNPGDYELDAQLDQIERIYHRIMNLEDRFNELQDATNDLYKQERKYTFQMSSYGRISDGFTGKYRGLPSSLSEPMRLSDVYGLCFSLLYLIETGDDIPWLYGACHGFMMEVCESLPWGMEDYNEMDDPIWEYENAEASVPKTAAIPDWNERKYTDKDSDYYFPRSLAQILYEETGCILPRDLSIYYPEYDTFRQYGIKGKDAGIMMLMSAALSTARRNIRATNLDPEAMGFLEQAPPDPGNKEEDAEEDEGIEGKDRTETPEQPKDEKDLLIDQLKEELKKSRAALHSAEVETRNTRKELASTKSIYEREHRELADLREIVFNAQFADGSGEPEQPVTVPEDTYPYETDKRITVFGGHDTFLKAIRPMLPTVRFIDAGYMNFSPELVRNSDIVWVQPNCISHSMFWNVVKYAKQYGVQLRYFGYASAEKCADQVVEADKR